MSKYEPTPEEKRRSSSDIWYEFSRLSACALLLQPGEMRPGYTHLGEDPEEILYDVCLTAFTIHARNLLAFFFDERKDGGTDKAGNDRVGNDDVIVSDFFPATSWSAPVVPGRDKAWVGDIREQVNKLTAHITYTRAKWREERGRERMKWRVPEIYEYLSTLWNDFEQKASPELYVPSINV